MFGGCIPKEHERQDVVSMFRGVLQSFSDQPVQTHIAPESCSFYFIPSSRLKLRKHLDLSLAHTIKLCESFFHGWRNFFKTLFRLFRNNRRYAEPLRHAW